RATGRSRGRAATGRCRHPCRPPARSPGSARAARPGRRAARRTAGGSCRTRPLPTQTRRSTYGPQRRSYARRACRAGTRLGPATPPLGVWLVVFGVDVVRDQVLERLDLLEELLRRDFALRGFSPEDVRRRLDCRPPRDLVRPLLRFAVDSLLGERLDAVEVDIRVRASLRLVERDPGPAAFSRYCLARDRLLERGELATRVVHEHEARVPGLRLVGLHPLDVHGLLRHLAFDVPGLRQR